MKQKETCCVDTSLNMFLYGVSGNSLSLHVVSCLSSVWRACSARGAISVHAHMCEESSGERTADGRANRGWRGSESEVAVSRQFARVAIRRRRRRGEERWKVRRRSAGTWKMPGEQKKQTFLSSLLRKSFLHQSLQNEEKKYRFAKWNIVQRRKKGGASRSRYTFFHVGLTTVHWLDPHIPFESGTMTYG